MCGQIWDELAEIVDTSQEGLEFFNVGWNRLILYDLPLVFIHHKSLLGQCVSKKWNTINRAQRSDLKMR